MDELLKSFGDDAPSGENLEYEKVFADLLLAAQPGEEKQIGESVIEAEPPKDSDVIEAAMAVLEQSHDLRAAVYLAEAELRSNGYEGFAKVTGYMRGCLEEFWDSCHPQLDDEDDDDPTMRVNTILGLTDSNGVLRALRNAPLTLSQAFGRVTLRDIAVADGEATPREGAENILDQTAIAAAFKDTKEDVLNGIFEGASKALEDIKAIDGVFNDKIPGLGPDLGPLMKILQKAVGRLAEETGIDADVPQEDAADGAEAAPATAKAPTGAITSPRDVEMALDRIMAYYASYEPSSPLPILLQRARRLVGADFLTIMKDVAPDGVHNVRLVGGLADDEE